MRFGSLWSLFLSSRKCTNMVKNNTKYVRMFVRSFNVQGIWDSHVGNYQ